MPRISQERWERIVDEVRSTGAEFTLSSPDPRHHYLTLWTRSGEIRLGAPRESSLYWVLAAYLLGYYTAKGKKFYLP